MRIEKLYPAQLTQLIVRPAHQALRPEVKQVVDTT